MQGARQEQRTEQANFSSLTGSVKKKTTPRQAFLSRMESVTAWERFLSLIEPIYPAFGASRPPLFIAATAFPDQNAFAAAKIAVFTASVISAVAGVWILWGRKQAAGSNFLR